MVHAFNPSTREAEAGRFLSWRPAWSTEFQDSQGYTEKPCLKKSKKITKSSGKVVYSKNSENRKDLRVGGTLVSLGNRDAGIQEQTSLAFESDI